MTVHSKASTVWNGSLADGSGTTTLATGAATLAVDWKARAEGSESTTTPEELLAAAHASCYSMALSNALSEIGSPPEQIETSAVVTFVPGEGIRSSVITVSARVPGIDQMKFSEMAEEAKDGCPVSQALAGVHIALESATLL
ncbi:OsmC family peroxiredoxin [Demequina sp. SO4-18]|uniref:OsmC family peroxiredoxin n=1 Tax=Demequina sp. SO4-18 TaxID=3401026 RepID=UPI003B59E7A0